MALKGPPELRAPTSAVLASGNWVTRPRRAEKRRPATGDLLMPSSMEVRFVGIPPMAAPLMLSSGAYCDWISARPARGKSSPRVSPEAVLEVAVADEILGGKRGSDRIEHGVSGLRTLGEGSQWSFIIRDGNEPSTTERLSNQDSVGQGAKGGVEFRVDRVESVAWTPVDIGRIVWDLVGDEPVRCT